MKRVSLLFATFLAALFFVLPSTVSSATTCVELPPLKGLHRICGVVFFPSGDRIANAKVLVLQAGKEIAVKQTSLSFHFDNVNVPLGLMDWHFGSRYSDSGLRVIMLSPSRKNR